MTVKRLKMTVSYQTRKRHTRYSRDTFEKDPQGTEFISDVGHFSLLNVRVLNASVDTLRQLFKGYCKTEWIEAMESIQQSEDKTPITIIDDDFQVGHGGRSGYRYRLQNNELGIIIFIGNRYAKTNEFGSHLKIECSPHWLSQRQPITAYGKLAQYAQMLMGHVEPAGCAVHLAIDVQGWTPPEDFEKRLVTRSKRRASFHEIDEITLEGGTACQVYGDRETFMFGSASGCQFSMYKKKVEALKRDKLDYWESIWKQKVNDDFKPQYNPEEEVWRLEFRFHHSVINQLHFDGATYQTYKDISKHLQAIFDYGLHVFRLDYSKTYVDPMWQLLSEDVVFSEHVDDLIVQRVYKTPARGSERNIGLLLGNMVSLYARHGFQAKALYKFIQKSEIYFEIDEYFKKRDVSLYQYLEEALARKRLVG